MTKAKKIHFEWWKLIFSILIWAVLLTALCFDWAFFVFCYLWVGFLIWGICGFRKDLIHLIITWSVNLWTK